MSNAHALPLNTMVIMELTGEDLDVLRDDAAEAGRVLRVALEVEPDGSTYLKVKADEYTWSPPLAATVTTAPLYDAEPQ